MSTLVILSMLLLILSLVSFLVSVSKKNMKLIYLALILFFCCVALSGYTIYKFIGTEAGSHF
jgi:hypothetical protein